MVSLINETVDASWIDRRIADDDRRAFALYLTDEGRMALVQALALIRAREEALPGVTSAKERGTLVGLFRRVERVED